VPDTRTYLERVPEAFTYPFKGHGKYMLIGGVIMMVVVGFFSLSPILFIILGILVFGFMGSYMMKIITHSSEGEEEPPDWPDFSEFGSDIISPAFQLLWTILIAYLPAIALMIYLWPIEGLQDQAMLLGVKLVCSVYFPMALIVMSHGRSYLAVGPHMVLPAIFKVPGDYIIAVAVLQLALILDNLLERVLFHIPILGGLIATFVSLYLIMACMHLLGLVYYKNRALLNWWGEEEEEY
jgi:hypothetical protein